MVNHQHPINRGHYTNPEEGAVLIIEAEGVRFYHDKKINDPGFKVGRLCFHLAGVKWPQYRRAFATSISAQV